MSADIFVSQWLNRFLLSFVPSTAVAVEPNIVFRSSQGDVLAAEVHEIAGMRELADRFEALLRLRTVTEDNCTPKVTKLLHILRDYERTPDFMALVFAQTRPSCAILARIIKMTHGLEWVQSDYLVGHGENVNSALSGLDSKQVGLSHFVQMIANELTASSCGPSLPQRGAQPSRLLTNRRRRSRFSCLSMCYSL